MTGHSGLHLILLHGLSRDVFKAPFPVPYLLPALDDSPKQRLGITLVGPGHLPSQALLTTTEPAQQAFPL